VSRRDDQRLDDILAAAAAIADHLTRGELDDGLVFDAVRVRLIEIGEAVKPSIPTCSCGNQPSRGWTSPVCATTSPIGTSIPRTRSCKPPSPKICHHWWPQSSGSSITLLLIPGRDPQSIRGSVAGVGSPRGFFSRNEASD
jgi:hypothetical protein